MKKIILSLITAMTISLAMNAQQIETPFAYPQAPDTLSTLEDRTSYVIMKFWDNCDFKKVMPDTAKFNRAFRDYISFVPYAYTDSIRKSANALLNRFKDNPKAILQIAEQADRNLFGPEAPFWSDEVFIMFARSVLANKKISNADKAPYMEKVKMLNSSQVGANVNQLSYTTRHGATHDLYNQNGEFIAMIFVDESCADCSIIMLRLETDVAVTNLVKSGKLKIVVINVGEATPKWKEEVADYPYEWEVGSAPDAAKYIDLRNMPNIYLLDNEHKVVLRNMSVDQLLRICENLNLQQNTTTKE